MLLAENMMEVLKRQWGGKKSYVGNHKKVYLSR